jgi:hypothetical protein
MDGSLKMVSALASFDKSIEDYCVPEKVVIRAKSRRVETKQRHAVTW